MFEKTRDNVFTKRWSLTREETGHDTNQTHAAEAEGVTPPKRHADEAPVGNKKPRTSTPEATPRKAKATGSKDKVADDKDDKCDKKAKQAIIKKAEAIKRRYNQCIGMQATITNSIATDAKYSWAKSEHQQGQFAQLTSSLASAVDEQKQFNMFFLQNPKSACDAEFGADETTRALEKFIIVEPAVSALEKAQTRFSRMHIANMES